MRRMLWVVLAVVVSVLCYGSYTYGKSQIKMQPIDIGIRVLDGDGQPIRPESGVHLQLFKFGTAWPRDRWANIVGHPDADGYLYATTNFPLDPEVTERMYKASR